jgi:surfeit locus 1 family protein
LNSAASIGGRLRGLILPALLTIAALAVLVSLGNWQVRRLAWKEGLIERVRERMAAPPLDLTGTDLADVAGSSSFLEENEFRPALLEGEFVPNGEVLVFTSLSDAKGDFDGPGFWVFCPFLTPAGTVLYVNRGFVPEARRDDFAPPPAGKATIRGPIRTEERGNRFTPDPDLSAKMFFARSPERIAHATGVTGAVVDFFIDLDASQTPPSGLPQAGETRTVFPNSHLGYAITWYGLAVALLAVFAAFVRARLGSAPQGRRLTPPGGAS